MGELVGEYDDMMDKLWEKNPKMASATEMKKTPFVPDDILFGVDKDLLGHGEANSDNKVPTTNIDMGKKGGQQQYREFVCAHCTKQDLETAVTVTGPVVMTIFRTYERGGERLLKALWTHNANMNGKLRRTLLINLLAVMAARKHRVAAEAN